MKITCLMLSNYLNDSPSSSPISRDYDELGVTFTRLNSFQIASVEDNPLKLIKY